MKGGGVKGRVDGGRGGGGRTCDPDGEKNRGGETSVKLHLRISSSRRRLRYFFLKRFHNIVTFQREKINFVQTKTRLKTRTRRRTIIITRRRTIIITLPRNIYHRNNNNNNNKNKERRP